MEAGFLAAGLIAVALIVFNSRRVPSMLYWPFPFLLWATVRFGPRGITSSLVVIMFLAILAATRGVGPFVLSSSWRNALEIQGYLILASIPLIVLAAVIEERRRAEAAALDNEDRLSIAVNSADIHIWEWQITNDKLVWPTIRDFGVADDEVTIASFYRLVHPDDRERVEQILSQSIADGVPYENEFRLLQHGTTRWFFSKGRVFYDREGKPMRMLGVAVDITKRKEAESALAESHERNQAILRALPDMMFLQSRDGTFLDYYARDQAGLLTSPESFLGKNAREVLPRDLADRVVAALSRLEESDQPQVLEYSLRIGDEDRHFEARMVEAEGQHVLSIVRDVTEERRAVEAVRQSEQKLLQNARHMRAMAARLITAQESERRRISLLLHDDVSQNVAAMGLTISKLKRKLPESNSDMYSELEKLGRQIHDLTSQIRRLSHQLHPDVLEHLGLVAALESFAVEFGETERIKTSFVAAVENGVPLDISVCFYRIALEALRNIARHSGATSAQVALKEAEGFLILEVSDTGKGFEVEKARRGNGLGLASSEERVRLLQGTLEIHSDAQSGTTLTARVPLART